MSYATIVRFIVTGGGTALLYAALLVGGAELAGLAPAAAAGVAYILAIGFNYAVHHRWTYRTDRPHRSSGARFLVVVLTLLAANVTATALLPAYFNVGYGIVQLMLGVVLAAVTFVVQGFWVFVRRDGSRS